MRFDLLAVIVGRIGAALPDKVDPLCKVDLDMPHLFFLRALDRLLCVRGVLALGTAATGLFLKVAWLLKILFCWGVVLCGGLLVFKTVAWGVVTALLKRLVA